MKSYAELEAARTDRKKKAAAKEKRKTAKRGRKRKKNGSEVDSTQPAVKMTEVVEVLEPVTCSENVEITRATEYTPEPQRAPVARMW